MAGNAAGQASSLLNALHSIVRDYLNDRARFTQVVTAGTASLYEYECLGNAAKAMLDKYMAIRNPAVHDPGQAHAEMLLLNMRCATFLLGKLKLRIDNKNAWKTHAKELIGIPEGHVAVFLSEKLEKTLAKVSANITSLSNAVRLCFLLLVR
jgi:hypothetical protein